MKLATQTDLRADVLAEVLKQAAVVPAPARAVVRPPSDRVDPTTRLNIAVVSLVVAGAAACVPPPPYLYPDAGIADHLAYACVCLRTIVPRDCSRLSRVDVGVTQVSDFQSDHQSMHAVL